MRPGLLLLLLLVFNHPLASYGDEVDFAQVLHEALSRRPLLQAARHEAAGVREAVGEARSRYLPRITLTERFMATDEPAGSLFISLNQEDLKLSPSADRYNFPPSRRDFETRLGIDQPLYDTDIAYGLRRSRKEAEAAEAEARWRAEEVAFAVFRAYLDVQRAQEAIVWLESARREAATIARLAGERYEAEVGLKADVLQAGVKLAEAERRLVTGGNDLILARRRLALAMGREGGEVSIAAPLGPEALGAGLESAGSVRGDLEALARRAEAAGVAARQSRAAYLPKAGLSASYALHDAETPFGTDAGSWTVGAGLTWELFDGGRRAHSSRKTDHQLKAARAKYLEAARMARLEEAEAALRAEEARLNLATAKKGAIEAEEGRRLLQQRYEAGLGGIADLLSTQTALDRARFAVVEAENRYLLALGETRFRAGTFVRNFLSPHEESPQ
jgi:outer membrane protein TolC